MTALVTFMSKKFRALLSSRTRRAARLVAGGAGAARIAALLGLALASSPVHPTFATTLYSEGFDSSLADVKANRSANTAVDYVDYSNFMVGATSFAIPEAPNRIAGSAATHGVLMRVNHIGPPRGTGAPAAINMLAGAMPISFSGDYMVSFDAYMNTSNPNGVGSTQQALFGLGVNDDATLEASFNRGAGAVGTWGWLTNENGSASEDAAINQNDVELADIGDSDNADVLAGVSPRLFNQAFGFTDVPTVNRSAARQWVSVQLSVVQGRATVAFNGVKFFGNAKTPNIHATATNGYAMLGLEDRFASISESPDLAWALFDNFVVTEIPYEPPTHLYLSLDYPGSTSTFANGIARGGEIAGEYTDAGGATHAFIRTAAGAYNSFDRPGAIGYTSANGINSAGQIAGLYSVDGGVTMRAYRRTGNTYLDLVPRAGSAFTQAVAINEAGHVVGSFLDASGNPQGFLFDGTTYTTLSHPSALLTVAIGINNAEAVVGNAVIGGAPHGFLYQNGAFTTFEVPGAISTVAEGINDAGQIIGLYTDAGGVDHGFLLDDGVYTTLDYPDASLTWGFAINNAGQIVGYYEDAGGAGHGFLATPLLEADFDSDGDVDAADLAAWTTNVGQTTGVDKRKGDADADGDVDGADLLVWQRQARPAAAATQAAGIVPEPTTLALAAICSFLLQIDRSPRGDRKRALS